MNIIIPLGGVGSRFSEEGYVRPKPLIRVLGKEMIFWVLDSLSLQPNDQVIIVYLPTFLGFDFERIVNEKYPKVQFVQLTDQTRGAAETVLYGLKALNKKQISRPVMLIDGDAFYTVDIVEKFRKVAPEAGAVMCFKAPHDRPIFSYITRKGDDNITNIKEKDKISDWANCGTYCFQDGKDLVTSIQTMLSRNEMQKGEFYTSGVIKIMLSLKKPFKAIEVSIEAPKVEFQVLGTPLQVEEFCQLWPEVPGKRWCFDLDNTLVTHPKVAGDYTSCQPIPHMIKVVRELHASGHTIVIHTARRMRTHSGNVSAVVADIGAITLNSLKEFGIPFHEVCFGKPYAHFYVDDLAVDPLWTKQTISKQTGFHNTERKVSKPQPSSLLTSPSPILPKEAPLSAPASGGCPMMSMEKPWFCSHEFGVVAFTAAMVLSFTAGYHFARIQR